MLKNSGFTLIETLLILSMISIVFLLIPLNNRKINLFNETDKLRSYALNCKIKAYETKRTISFTIEKNDVYYNDNYFKLDNKINCGSHNVNFNAKGNVNVPTCITCYYLNNQHSFTINLGSGYIDEVK